jgi:hypothetical protein
VHEKPAEQDRLSATLLSLALIFVVGSLFRHVVETRRRAG